MIIFIIGLALNAFFIFTLIKSLVQRKKHITCLKQKVCDLRRSLDEAKQTYMINIKESDMLHRSEMAKANQTIVSLTEQLEIANSFIIKIEKSEHKLVIDNKEFQTTIKENLKSYKTVQILWYDFMKKEKLDSKYLDYMSVIEKEGLIASKQGELLAPEIIPEQKGYPVD